MIIEDIEYSVGGATFKGLIAAPGGPEKRPAILVVHEAPGFSGHVRNIATKLAEAGYVAFAIDYIGNGQPLSSMPEVFTRLEKWTADPTFLREICDTTHKILLKRDDVDPSRIGGFGYCFGGQVLIEHARTGADIKAIVGFHAGLSANRPDESKAIQGRLLMILGASDPIASKAQRDAFEEEMTTAGVDWTLTLYGGVVHSFTNPAADGAGVPGVAYNAAADKNSWALARQFLTDCGV